MKTTLAILALMVGSAAATPNGWWQNETELSFVPWPDEMTDLISEETRTFKSEGFPLPVLRVFQSFPESEPVWPYLKPINWRLHPVFWPRVHYFLQDGLEYGCRSDGNGPMNSPHCHQQCIHQGRYCVPHTEEELPDGRKGHDVIKEVTRRLCMDTVYHAKAKRFYWYLEEFDKRNCFGSDHVLACSMAAMEKIGMHYDAIRACVREQDTDLDVEHPVLERNMRHVRRLNATRAHFPTVKVESAEGETLFRMEDIHLERMFIAYCAAFPKHLERPMACDFCEPCHRVRDCLWGLTCDGVDFSIDQINAAVAEEGHAQGNATAPPNGSDTSPPNPETTSLPSTPAPTANPKPDQQHEEEDQDSTVTNNEIAHDDQQGSTTQDSQQKELEGSNSDAATKKKSGFGKIFLVLVLILVVLAGSCPVLFYIYRKRRTKKLMKEIVGGKYSTEYKDDGGYKDHDLTNKKLPGRQDDHHPDEIFVDEDGDVHSDNIDEEEDDIEVDVIDIDDIQEEELLDDESEFVEKRLSRGTGVAIAGIV